MVRHQYMVSRMVVVLVYDLLKSNVYLCPYSDIVFVLFCFLVLHYLIYSLDTLDWLFFFMEVIHCFKNNPVTGIIKRTRRNNVNNIMHRVFPEHYRAKKRFFALNVLWRNPYTIFFYVLAHFRAVNCSTGSRRMSPRKP